MERWGKDNRKEIVMVDMEGLLPKDHLLCKIEKLMDYDWLYARLSPYYSHENGRNGTDPVVLVKMVLLQHLYGIPSPRQTYERIEDTMSYRWFLGYNLLDKIPHFATVSYAFCNRFPAELSTEIFEHILNKALNNGMVDPSIIFIDGTHIKASANKKKYQKKQVAKAARIYDEQLRTEVNEQRTELGKKPIDDNDDNEPPTVTKTVSTTDPESGMFVKGEHERQFAYEAHTVCERHGIVLDVGLTPGNTHDSAAWDEVYDRVSENYEVKYVVMDAGYKTLWIAKKTLESGQLPILPYIRYKGNREQFKAWEYSYDSEKDTYTCPKGGVLRHTTTDREGKRTYRTTPKDCVNCPHKAQCGANEKGQKIFQSHIWQAYLDAAEEIRKTDYGKELYSMRKETIERVFGDAKEKHSMRYTQHRGLARVTQWVTLKYAAMNLKKLATWCSNSPALSRLFSFFTLFIPKISVFTSLKSSSLTV